jgi:hypothetical protein
MLPTSAFPHQDRARGNRTPVAPAGEARAVEHQGPGRVGSGRHPDAELASDMCHSRALLKNLYRLVFLPPLVDQEPTLGARVAQLRAARSLKIATPFSLNRFLA